MWKLSQFRRPNIYHAHAKKHRNVISLNDLINNMDNQ